MFINTQTHKLKRLADRNSTKNRKSELKDETVIPLSTNEYRYILKTKNEEGKYVTIRDENYKAQETRIMCGAEEDVAGKAIRRLTRKGATTYYIQTRDNKENQSET